MKTNFARIKHPRPFWETLTIVMFLGLLWLPTLDHFFKLDHARMPNENRMPAKWPRFGGLAQSRDFITGVENYFNDHFGFRNRLIRWNHHWKHQLFRAPASREVLEGRDGWLFYCGDQMLEYLTRKCVCSERELLDWQRLLEQRRDWLRERGIKYLFVVPPDKHNVYPELLPAWLERSPTSSKVRQLADYLKAHSDVEFIDLTPVLLEAKRTRMTYLKTDTHWNSFGGFAAYRALVQGLSRQMPALEPMAPDTYEWQPLSQAAGDLARIGDKESTPETQALKPVPVRPVVPLAEIYDPVRLPHKGPKESRPCYTHNDKASGKALVFHDSFACTWYRTLGQHFNEVVYLWHYDWDWPLIEREKPDVVIDEMLERFFNIQDPNKLLRK